MKEIKKMTPEQCKLVEDNIKLGYHHVEYWCRTQTVLGFDELVELANYAMCKAAISFDPSRACFATFAKTVVFNTIRDELRKVKMNEVRLRDSDVHVSDFDFEDFEEAVDLGLALGRLPDRYREIFLSVYRDGLKQYEAAEKYGIAQSTVCIILAQSKELLATMLAE